MPSRNICTPAELWETDGGVCTLCGQPVEREDATRDHVIPKSMGGSMSRRNLRLACRVCNEARGDTFPFGRFRKIGEEVQRLVWLRDGGCCVGCGYDRALVFCKRSRRRAGRPKVYLLCMPCVLRRSDQKRMSAAEGGVDA